MDFDVVIVGAGPTGLMAAALLVRSGVRVRIIDKNNDQAHESRALGVQARSMELFHNIGLIREVLGRGMITKGMHLYINGKRKGEISFQNLGRNDTPYAFLLMLSQADTESILVEDLKSHGVLVERGIEAIAMDQQNDFVCLTLKSRSGTSVVQSSYVLGADGAHSAVRDFLGLSFEGAAYPQLFALGDVRVDWPLPHDRLCVFLHGKHFGAHFPLKGQTLSRVLAISSGKEFKANPDKAGSVSMSLDELQDAFQKVTVVPTHLSSPKWLARFHIHHRGVGRYRVGRVFVAGDAAHIHSPVGAQGMNTGLQDVANLCWKLAMVINMKSPDRLLDTYQTERWPIGQKLLHFTDRLFLLIATQNAILNFARDTFFKIFAPLSRMFASVRYRAFNFISQLGIRYHPSEFVDGKKLSKLSPGCRAPNAKISNETEMFDLLTGYRFHLLVFSKQELTAQEKKSLENVPHWLKIHWVTSPMVRKEEVYEMYGISGQHPKALYVIRPDGYIAYQDDDLNVGMLNQFLQKFASV